MNIIDHIIDFSLTFLPFYNIVLFGSSGRAHVFSVVNHCMYYCYCYYQLLFDTRQYPYHMIINLNETVQVFRQFANLPNLKRLKSHQGRFKFDLVVYTVEFGFSCRVESVKNVNESMVSAPVSLVSW